MKNIDQLMKDHGFVRRSQLQSAFVKGDTEVGYVEVTPHIVDPQDPETIQNDTDPVYVRFIVPADEGDDICVAVMVLPLDTYLDSLVRAGEDEPAGPRPLHEIADEIVATWENVNYAARPYLEALADLNTIDEHYGEDTARSIVRYFLSNARSWRGPEAKRIKEELKSLL